MITQGLSSHEISLITKILDENNVEYHVDAAGGANEVKVKGGRGDASFYQIEIPSDQFNKLPQAAQEKLFNLGIYPEMEAPDFSEEVTVEKRVSDPVKVRSNIKKIETIFIVIMLTLVVLFVMKVIREQ